MKDVGRHEDEWEPGSPRTRSHPAVSFLRICNDETQSGEAGVNVVVNGPRFDIMDAVCGGKRKPNNNRHATPGTADIFIPERGRKSR